MSTDLKDKSLEEIQENLKLEFQACLAEYQSVQGEARDRAEASRRAIQYGFVVLGLISSAFIVLLQDQITGSGASPTHSLLSLGRFPTYYVIALPSFLFLFLISLYADESHKVYMAQAYTIYILRPNLLRILDQHRPKGHTLVFEDVWQWDQFGVTGARSWDRVATSFIRAMLTMIIPVVGPVIVFLIAAYQAGHLTLWEWGLAAILIMLLILQAYFFARARMEVYQHVNRWLAGQKGDLSIPTVFARK